MEENIKEKTEQEKSIKPVLKPGGAGPVITPVSSPFSQPTTPLPRVPAPPFTPFPKIAPKEKRETTTLLLLVIVILNIISLWLLISIGLDKIPGFLIKKF